MKRSGLRCTLAWAAFALAACGSVGLGDRSKHDPERPPRAVATETRIAQAHFGADARFVVCQAPGCPVRTPKSLPHAAAVTTTDTLPTTTTDARPASMPASATMAAAPARELIEAPPPLRVVVRFGFASSALEAHAREALDLAAVQPQPVRRVLIEGRTDSVGSAAVNQALAQARAEAVRQHLASRHPRLLAAADVRLQSQGACCYAASNDSTSGRAANRRVEVTFERDGGDL